MALETLKNVRVIDGFNVAHRVGLACIDVDFEATPIVVNHPDNMITFKIQNGPIKENGVNGCQVDTMIKTALLIIQGLNAQFPCDENEIAINHLTAAIIALKDRKRNREERGVEGTNQA